MRDISIKWMMMAVETSPVNDHWVIGRRSSSKTLELEVLARLVFTLHHGQLAVLLRVHRLTSVG